MAETELGPLAPASTNIRSDEEALPIQLKHPKQQRSYIKCCGCVTAIFLILAVVILILVFTIFDIKNPVVKMNKVTVQQWNLVSNGSPQNATVIVNVSVKNPNAACFKFSNGTTTIYYRNNQVGQAKTPPGKVKARRTISMNVTVEIIPSKIVAVPGYSSDASSGSLTMNSLTVVDGKVKVMSIVKKHIIVTLNCTITYNFKSMAIQQQHCRHRISI